MKRQLIRIALQQLGTFALVVFTYIPMYELAQWPLKTAILSRMHLTLGILSLVFFVVIGVALAIVWWVNIEHEFPLVREK